MLERRVELQYGIINRVQLNVESLEEQLTLTRNTVDRHLLGVRLDVLALHDLLQNSSVGGQSDPTRRALVRRQSSKFGLQQAATKDKFFVPSLVYPWKGKQGEVAKRFPLKPAEVPWESTISHGTYEPVEWTAPHVFGAEWADPADPNEVTFNQHDGKVNRKSCQEVNGQLVKIETDFQGRPKNPYGRTGMSGRGLLGKWGVNWAADAVVTRWRRDDKDIVMERDGKKVLEFVAIRRKDGGGTVQSWRLRLHYRRTPSHPRRLLRLGYPRWFPR